MRLFFSKKSEQAKVLSPLPGMYAGADVHQLVFDRTTRIQVDRNHWKVATLAVSLIALAAVATRQSPPSVVKSYGISADANGLPVVRQLQPYEPKSLDIRVAFKDLITRWFTIEPVLTPLVEDSRMFRNIKSAKEQLVGAARKQFDQWFDEDAPFKALAGSPGLVREVELKNVATLPDNTVAVEFIATTSEEGQKPKRWRYAMTFRYEVKPPQSDAEVLGPNPFGIYPVYFSRQKTPA
ncbi:type IV secretion system protein [Ralstonia nicotianae]|uniref:type IV secretion system protein n=1 Tax=Ralstonia pseudosolanacearum TaxID=1310165 RepID=UPI0020053CC4|nr:type IV secretion system protein [Ralstonia pseudosolanacearum]MCK4118405.1 type IV secretion system protein [Ralstonia pseudosolanacearum]